MSAVLEVCPGCGLRRPSVDAGVTDPYGGASASCWAVFNEILARDYSDWRPGQHRLTVDAYMAQHPGHATPSGRRSTIVHLVGLYASLELGQPAAQVGRLLGQVFPDKTDDVRAFEPVPEHGAITVETLQGASSAEEYQRRNLAWAAAVWSAWSAHHAEVRRLAARAAARR